MRWVESGLRSCEHSRNACSYAREEVLGSERLSERHLHLVRLADTVVHLRCTPRRACHPEHCLCAKHLLWAAGKGVVACNNRFC